MMELAQCPWLAAAARQSSASTSCGDEKAYLWVRLFSPGDPTGGPGARRAPKLVDLVSSVKVYLEVSGGAKTVHSQVRDVI